MFLDVLSSHIVVAHAVDEPMAVEFVSEVYEVSMQGFLAFIVFFLGELFELAFKLGCKFLQDFRRLWIKQEVFGQNVKDVSVVFILASDLSYFLLQQKLRQVVAIAFNSKVHDRARPFSSSQVIDLAPMLDQQLSAFDLSLSQLLHHFGILLAVLLDFKECVQVIKLMVSPLVAILVDLDTFASSHEVLRFALDLFTVLDSLFSNGVDIVAGQDVQR